MPVKKRYYIVNFNKKGGIVLYTLENTRDNYKPKAVISGEEDFIELINYTLNE